MAALAGDSSNNIPAVTGTNSANSNGMDGFGGPLGGEGVNGESRSGWAAAGYHNPTGHGPGVWVMSHSQSPDGTMEVAPR